MKYMNHQLTQDERLTCLVEVFKTDSEKYRRIETPRGVEGRRRILRPLMNIRRPGPLPETPFDSRMNTSGNGRRQRTL